jgi:3-dehydroquinate synthase
MSQAELAAITIETPTGDSRILVGDGLLGDLGRLATERWPRARVAWLISDEAVFALHGEAAVAALAGAGLRVRHTRVPAGEASKSLAEASRLYDWLLGGNVERADLVIALGGGVVGDLAGFVAATCLRGLALVQVPTSLLAMVDSSVGGKTGVNHPAGKNLIGAFYQPPLVVVDPALLRTLPPRELRSGWAEVVKYGLIEGSIPDPRPGERPLLPWLEADAADLARLAEPVTGEVIRRCIDLKARVVRADPLEQGVRAILNYGHTVGHAVEALAGYGALLHGEAVAIGMRAAALIAADLGRCAPALVERQQALLRRFGLPETAPGLAPAALWPYLRRDKKAAAGALRWVLPATPGYVEIVHGVDEAVVDRALALITGAAPA